MKIHQEHKKRKSNISTKKIIFLQFLLCPWKKVSGMKNVCKVMYKYNFFHKQLLEDYLLFPIAGI